MTTSKYMWTSNKTLFNGNSANINAYLEQGLIEPIIDVQEQANKSILIAIATAANLVCDDSFYNTYLRTNKTPANFKKITKIASCLKLCGKHLQIKEFDSDYWISAIDNTVLVMYTPYTIEVID